MADPVSPRNAVLAYSIYPTPPGDAHGVVTKRPVAPPAAPSLQMQDKPWDPSDPTNGDPAFAQHALSDIRGRATASGAQQPLWQSPKTADAMIRMVHQGLLGMPGQERARFLDAWSQYQQTLNDTLQGLKFNNDFIGGKPAANALPANFEAPAAAPGDEDAIAHQMGEDPAAIRAKLIEQQANPTQPIQGPPPDNRQYRPGAGVGGPSGRASPMAAAARQQGY